MKSDSVATRIWAARRPLRKWPILLGLAVAAMMVVVLFCAKPPFAPDVSVRLLAITNTGLPNAFTLTLNNAEYEIVNRSDGSVRLYGLSVEQRNPTCGPNSFPERTAKWSPAQSDILRPGERRKIVLAVGLPRQHASEFRGVCTVTPMSSWPHDWLRRQSWSKKLFRILRPPPPPPSYSFSSAWRDTE